MYKYILKYNTVLLSNTLDMLYKPTTKYKNYPVEL